MSLVNEFWLGFLLCPCVVIIAIAIFGAISTAREKGEPYSEWHSVGSHRNDKVEVPPDGIVSPEGTWVAWYRVRMTQRYKGQCLVKITTAKNVGKTIRAGKTRNAVVAKHKADAEPDCEITWLDESTLSVVFSQPVSTRFDPLLQWNGVELNIRVEVA